MKQYNPTVSVIINCYNGEKYLNQCVKSVINQKYKNWEIIFWDNQSKDNSLKIIKSFKRKKIRIFQSKKFVNLYKARNLAIKEATGDYITFLDTDDFWHKNKLLKQINLIKKNDRKKCKMIFSNYYVKDQSNNSIHLKHKKKLPSGYITQQLINEYDVGILTVLIDRKVFKKKGFNPSYNIIGDFDFFIKFSIKNKILVIQEPLATYRLHKNNLSLKSIYLYKDELNKWIHKNDKKDYFKNCSFNSLKFLVFKLKIKCFFKYFLPKLDA